jgi:hypothetical protein
VTTQPVSLNFYLYPNATFSEQQTLRDADGVLVDLTGYSARMHVRRAWGDPAPLLQLSTDDGTLVLGDAAGTISITLASDAISALDITLDPDGEAWQYDLLLSNDTQTPATVERLLQGMVFVVPGVTA